MYLSPAEFAAVVAGLHYRAKTSGGILSRVGEIARAQAAPTGKVAPARPVPVTDLPGAGEARLANWRVANHKLDVTNNRGLLPADREARQQYVQTAPRDFRGTTDRQWQMGRNFRNMQARQGQTGLFY